MQVSDLASFKDKKSENVIKDFEKCIKYNLIKIKNAKKIEKDKFVIGVTPSDR